MSLADATIGGSKSRPHRPIVRILFIVILVCALPVIFVLLVNRVNNVRYSAVTRPLRSDDPAVREDAIRTLRGGGPEIAHSLGRALRDDPDPSVRAEAARVLAEFDEATLESDYNPNMDLRNAMKQDVDADVREAARQALGKLEGRQLGTGAM